VLDRRLVIVTRGRDTMALLGGEPAGGNAGKGVSAPPPADLFRAESNE